jgi:hypothetical protein
MQIPRGLPGSVIRKVILGWLGIGPARVIYLAPVLGERQPLILLSRPLVLLDHWLVLPPASVWFTSQRIRSTVRTFPVDCRPYRVGAAGVFLAADWTHLAWTHALGHRPGKVVAMFTSRLDALGVQLFAVAGVTVGGLAAPGLPAGERTATDAGSRLGA